MFSHAYIWLSAIVGSQAALRAHVSSITAGLHWQCWLRRAQQFSEASGGQVRSWELFTYRLKFAASLIGCHRYPTCFSFCMHIHLWCSAGAPESRMRDDTGMHSHVSLMEMYQLQDLGR
ncbi:uncharacterized protein C8Q71DRAFT_133527 [Rhodofomes roseus]|uniref:Secreted protein n=1 Tax=Rhodofomes roseus TaxID=34475 RepID=A0ABQ8KBQ5_9APHY|nr:uncharacterized protein C8Q71DRAFT_133527 [Rhodofomes roseus]KAH9834950.1 hypothetical protein C8Q71DRAFT_133527 [Rhodofomes roseus]